MGDGICDRMGDSVFTETRVSHFTQKIEIKPSLIQLQKEIKSLGVFKVKINLHSDIQSEILVEVLPAEITQ